MLKDSKDYLLAGLTIVTYLLIVDFHFMAEKSFNAIEIISILGALAISNSFIYLSKQDPKAKNKKIVPVLSVSYILCVSLGFLLSENNYGALLTEVTLMILLMYPPLQAVIFLYKKFSSNMKMFSLLPAGISAYAIYAKYFSRGGLEILFYFFIFIVTGGLLITLSIVFGIKRYIRTK